MDEQDTRIPDAENVRRALKTKGFHLCIKKWEEIKAQAHKDAFDERICGVNQLSIKDNVIRLHNQIEEWLNVPNVIIQAGEDAASEKKAEREIEEKEAEPFMEGRG